MYTADKWSKYKLNVLKHASKSILEGINLLASSKKREKDLSEAENNKIIVNGASSFLKINFLKENLVISIRYN